MAEHTADSFDLAMLKRQLNETTEACQKCMVAIDHQVLWRSDDCVDSSTAPRQQQLHQKIADLEAELKAERERNNETLNEGQQTRLDALVMQYKQKIQDIEDAKIQVETENKKLRMELHTCQKKLHESEELISTLTNSRSQMAPYDQDKVQLLEAQLKVYQEDFATERQERQHCESRIANLEQILSYLTKQKQVQQMAIRPLSYSGQHPEPALPHNYIIRGNSDSGHAPQPGQMQADDTADAVEETKTIGSLEPDEKVTNDNDDITV